MQPNEWIAHYSTKDYEGTWTIAPLRAPAGLSTAIWSTPMPEIFQNTEILERCAYFQEVIATIECVTTSVRLMKLDPGAEIKEHEDSLGEDEARLHVPILTNPNVDFYLEGERVEMAAGSCWYLDFTKPHRVVNNGAEPRVHMVIDCIRNDWLNGISETKR
ncbi:MAG: aspartyl/asparaginyl beta-hydroxylase domain-containing protein [Chloroflexota bacterium]